MRTLRVIVKHEIPERELEKRLRSVKAKIELYHLIINNFDFGPHTMRDLEIYDTQLNHCSFRKAVLKKILFGELDAERTDFRSARIDEGDIIWSHLAHARFDCAELPRVYFFKTDCAGASFRQADLVGANFVQCDLTAADFTGAFLDHAQFSDCCLKEARGLPARRLAYEPAMFSERLW